MSGLKTSAIDRLESNLNQKVDFLYAMVSGALIVIAIVVITLVLQYFTATQVAYQNLANEIKEVNIKTD